MPQKGPQQHEEHARLETYEDYYCKNKSFYCARSGLELQELDKNYLIIMTTMGNTIIATRTRTKGPRLTHKKGTAIKRTTTTTTALLLAICFSLQFDLIKCDEERGEPSEFGPKSVEDGESNQQQVGLARSARIARSRHMDLFDEPLSAASENGHVDDGPMAILHPAAPGSAQVNSEASLATRRRQQQQQHQNQAELSNGLQSNKLHIVHLLGPDSVQNNTQNVTLDCMFKFDPKLDQRLTIKWYFNDEVEPIYQWLPQLNKRVYSDKWELLLDKSYQVTEDVDWMLQAYKWLINEPTSGVDNSGSESEEADKALASGTSTQSSDSRKLLANRLNRLAKLGSDHSKQLLRSLRQALAMEVEEFAKYRALRLIKPSLSMSGRYTCSVSSLESDDLQSKRLVVYEPPKSFAFNVSRVAPNQFNLTCQASATNPRPSLALFRYRAGQLSASEPVGHRPRLAATQLKQEPLVGLQTQLTISASPSLARQAQGKSLDLDEASSNDINLANLEAMEAIAMGEEEQARPASYEIVAWALVDESTLSSNLVTQFECVLTIENTNYEQRQSLALQKGWHVNSQALMARSTLVGLMSVLASVLCLMVALVSALLVFKLMRRHANKPSRVHQTLPVEASPGGNQGGGQTNVSCELETSSSPSTSSTGSARSSGSNTSQRGHERPQKALRSLVSSSVPRLVQYSSFGPATTQKPHDSDGIYRVPETLANHAYLTSDSGTQYDETGAIIEQRLTPSGGGCGWSSSTFTPTASPYGQLYGNSQLYLNQKSQEHEPRTRQSGGGGILRNSATSGQRAMPATISVNGKQLYC